MPESLETLYLTIERATWQLFHDYYLLMHRQHVPVQDLYSVKLSALEVTLGQYCAYSLKLTQYPVKPMDPVY